jgi:hypothetical protein
MPVLWYTVSVCPSSQEFGLTRTVPTAAQTRMFMIMSVTMIAIAGNGSFWR